MFLMITILGPSFPIYYYSQTTILDGKTGKSFLDSKITDSGGSHSLLGGMSIAQTHGGDLFLHFQSHCRGKYENSKDPYRFIPDSDIIQQSRADVCMLRYNTSTLVKLNAISRHVEPPGAVIFTSDNIALQLNQSDKSVTSTSNIKQPLKHPKMRLKVPQNRYQPQPPIEVNKKQSNMNDQAVRHQQQQQQIKLPPMLKNNNINNIERIPKDDIPEINQVVVNDGQKQKALKFREKQLSDDVAAHRLKLKEKEERLLNNFEDPDQNVNNFNDIMNKITMMDLPREEIVKKYN
jgi:hypothetical protein